MKICIPSSNRPNKCSSAFIRDAVIFIPEGQLINYQNFNDNEIIGVPEQFYGITKTRNYILDYFKNEDIVFLDDDVKECGYFKKGLRIDMKSEIFSEDWSNKFAECFKITKGFGLKIWGAENGGSKFANHVLNPIDAKGSINGTIIGITANSYKFDESFQVKEDFDLILRSYKEDGGFLKFNNFYWRSKHWANPGGCVDYRTNKMENDCIQMLINRHGKNHIKIGTGKNMFHCTLKF